MNSTIADLDRAQRMNWRNMNELDTLRQQLTDTTAQLESCRLRELACYKALRYSPMRPDELPGMITRLVFERDSAEKGAVAADDEKRNALEALSGAVQERDEALNENRKLRNYLEDAGWGRCDIPACNCNGWHHLRDSVEERKLKQQLEDDTRQLREALGDAYKERDHYIGIAGNRWQEMGRLLKEISAKRLIRERDEAVKALNAMQAQLRKRKARSG